MVLGEQPPLERQQNQGTGRGLQQEAAADLYTPHHQRDSSGEGEQF